jgi:hypothetical protein
LSALSPSIAPVLTSFSIVARTCTLGISFGPIVSFVKGDFKPAPCRSISSSIATRS